MSNQRGTGEDEGSACCLFNLLSTSTNRTTTLQSFISILWVTQTFSSLRSPRSMRVKNYVPGHSFVRSISETPGGSRSILSHSLLARGPEELLYFYFAGWGHLTHDRFPNRFLTNMIG